MTQSGLHRAPTGTLVELTGSTAETEIFEQHRRHLTGVAYRITGSWTDAEDIAQDVWLRWANAHRDVDRPRNWLLRVTDRASLDRLRRLKRRRETYVGPWLPEPVSLAPDPEDTAERRSRLGHVNMRPGIIISTAGQVLSAMTFDHDRSGRSWRST